MCVKVDGMKLTPQGVFVIWEWEWSDSVVDSDSESDEKPLSANPYLHSESDSDTERSLRKSHTVTFKCIGSTYHPESQEALAKVAAILKRGEDVPVRIAKEPDNQYDSKAIAFQCKLGGNWIRIGYIVKEALLHVHKEMDNNKITSVKFAWAKYLVTWFLCWNQNNFKWKVAPASYSMPKHSITIVY